MVRSQKRRGTEAWLSDLFDWEIDSLTFDFFRPIEEEQSLKASTPVDSWLITCSSLAHPKQFFPSALNGGTCNKDAVDQRIVSCDSCGTNSEGDTSGAGVAAPVCPGSKGNFDFLNPIDAMHIAI